MSRVEAGRSGMLLCTHFWPAATIVEVRGTVDACNADRLGDCVRDLAGRGQPLVVDLSGVHFFGGDGFRALVGIAERCWRINMRWALVISEAVDRLLRIADPDHGLPVAATVEEAVQDLTVSRVIA